MFKFRDREMAMDVITKLKSMNLAIKIMHVCGTHQDTLVKYGLMEMLDDVGVNVRQGPGCPVCVTTPQEIIALIMVSAVPDMNTQMVYSASMNFT